MLCFVFIFVLFCFGFGFGFGFGSVFFFPLSHLPPAQADGDWYSYLETGFTAVASATYDAALATGFLSSSKLFLPLLLIFDDIGEAFAEQTPVVAQSIKDSTYSTWSSVSSYTQPVLNAYIYGYFFSFFLFQIQILLCSASFFFLGVDRS